MVRSKGPTEVISALSFRQSYLESVNTMPGILPMKIIRVGNNAQSRIAQACDRCRGKKIRCDGIRPQCTQCSTLDSSTRQVTS